MTDDRTIEVMRAVLNALDLHEMANAYTYAAPSQVRSNIERHVESLIGTSRFVAMYSKAWRDSFAA